MYLVLSQVCSMACRAPQLLEPPASSMGLSSKMLWISMIPVRVLHTGPYWFLRHLLVPVFDGRSTAFTFGEDLEHLQQVLPAWEGEIPEGSFAVVGYTVSTFTNSSRLRSLSCNLQFVIVIGSP